MFCCDFDPAHPVSEVASELVQFLSQEGLDASGLLGLLGPTSLEALYRGEPGAVELVTSGSAHRSHQLINAFYLHHHFAPSDFFALFEGAQHPHLASKLLECRVAIEEDEGIRVVLDIRPHIIGAQEMWVFSDVDASLVDHIPNSDHVLGVGSASLSLLRSTPTSEVGSVLDLGTGSGVQLLGQSSSASVLVGTDIHQRALDLCQATLSANKVQAELINGSWFEPVKGHKFDRIVANPPFVVGLPEVGLVYRDSGLNLDEASRLVVSQASDYLNVDGTAHLLAAWIHKADEPWQQRVASWIPSDGVSAWFMQRDVVDPATYVSTWLKDESIDPRSPEGRERTQLWLKHFADNDVVGIGFGFVALQHIGENPSEVVAEDMSQPFDDPLGPEVEEYFSRTRWLRDSDEETIGNSRYGLRPGIAHEVISLSGDSTDTAPEHMGFTKEVIRLTRTDGPRFSHEIDETVTAILSGLNPNGLTLTEICSLYAYAQDLDEEALLSEVTPLIVDLVRHGFVIPAQLLGREVKG